MFSAHYAGPWIHVVGYVEVQSCSRIGACSLTVSAYHLKEVFCSYQCVLGISSWVFLAGVEFSVAVFLRLWTCYIFSSYYDQGTQMSFLRTGLPFALEMFLVRVVFKPLDQFLIVRDVPWTLGHLGPLLLHSMCQHDLLAMWWLVFSPGVCCLSACCLVFT